MNITKVLTAIITALLIGATIEQGLDAVSNGLDSYLEGRKQANIQYCYATVEAEKPKTAGERAGKQETCIADEDDKVEAQFVKTRKYIACFKILVPSAFGSSSSAESVLSAAGATCSL